MVCVCVCIVSNGEFNSLRVKGYTRPSMLEMLTPVCEFLCFYNRFTYVLQENYLGSYKLLVLKASIG